jgi:hypothetical protein
MAVFDYGDTLLLFEVRGLVGKNDVPSKVTNEYYTSEGVIQGGKFTARDGGKTYDVEVPDVKVTPGGAFGSFIAAVRSRKPEDNNADAETAHYSAALCHLANASFRLGEPQPFGMQSKSLGDNKEIVSSFDNIRENLKAVDVKLDDATYTVGPKLTFDPKSEKFTGERAEEANRLITREYRAPFVVPKEV